MNYKKVYDKIIENAKFEQQNNIREKGNGTYYEKHHIIPRCIGGTDDEDNLVLLTGREHFLCHKLLHKDDPKNSKLFFSYKCMCEFSFGFRHVVSSSEFAYLKESLGKYMSEINKGRVPTEEQRQKMRDNNPNKGGLKEDHKKNISLALTGRKNSEEHKRNSSIGLRKLYETRPGNRLGVQKTEEEIEKQRISLIKYWETRTPEEMKEWSEKFSGENNANYGKERTDEVKNKISNTKLIDVLFDGVLYHGFKNLCKELNITQKVASRIIRDEVKKGNPNYKVYYPEDSKVIGRKCPDKQKRILFAGIEYESLTECGKCLNKSPERIGQILRQEIKNNNTKYKYL